MLRRIAAQLEETGTLYVAAPLCGVSRSWVQEWAAEDDRVQRAIDRATARFVRGSIRRLQFETDPVLAQSHRFIAARRCPDFREEKSQDAKALTKVARALVRFERAPRPEAASIGRGP
jgi:hypothetical protein